MIDIVARVLAILNSDVSPSQISLGISLSMIAGLTPVMSLHNTVVLLLLLLLRANISAFVAGFISFGALSYLLDPLFHYLGHTLLTAQPLQELWISIYNNPYLRLTRFNNTIVMGSLVFSLTLIIPLYFFATYLIVRYRDVVMEAVRKSRIMQLLKGSRFYRVYEKFAAMRGE